MYDTIFLAMHAVVFPAWGALILAPRAAVTHRWVHSGLIPVVLGALYAALLFAGVVLGQAHPDAGMTSLGAVMALFSHPVGSLTGWVHFLVFDLFVGAWVARDAARLGLAHAGTVPVLLLCLMFGPLGLMAHVLRRGLGGYGWRFG
jgi:hypothetical protein